MAAVSTLPQLLQHAATNSADKGISLYALGNLEAPAAFLPYPDLLERAQVKAEQLKTLGVQANKPVLLHFKRQLDNIEWFWATTLAGAIPAMSTPFSNNAEQRKNHILYLNDLLESPICLTKSDLLGEFAGQDVLNVVPVETLSAGGAPSTTIPSKSGSDIACLMLTSGSTGNAKAVALTHSMVTAAVEAKSAKNGTTSESVFFNWIGFDHVASLTEVHLHAMFAGANQIHAEAADLVQDPLSFLILLDRHQVEYTFGPNFFVAAVLRTLQDFPDDVYNLSSLKSLVSGGEANVVETSAKAAAAFARFGAAPNAVKPAFGMTETCAGSIYNMDFPVRDQARGNEFGSLGSCHKGMEMRIVDEEGKEVPAGVSGSLEVRGPVVFSEYYRNEEATKSSFHDGWFITGDNGKIEADGQLDLTGRSKEILIINGINYTPHEVETTIADVEGTLASFTAVFAYRPKGSETENIAVVYAPTYKPDDLEKRISTNNAISKGVMEQVGVRPLILPLDTKVLQKTTLGKLSRTKIKKQFEAGAFEIYQQLNEQETAIYKQMNYTAPATPLEEQILEAFASVIDIPASDIGATEHLFGLGVNSIAVIKIKKKLEDIVGRLIPVSVIITNPTARTLADALDNMNKPKEYNPVIVLQAKGDKTPLWLIHPGVGEVLVFLGLAAHVTDRPLYALRARGFEQGEAYFKDTLDAVTTYHQHIKQVQPEGPYAIGGYSFGSMYAFEITKILNSHGDEVKMLAALNLPPHIKHRMRQLDWTACLLHLSYFLDFFPEEEAHAVHPELSKHDREYCLDWVVKRAPKERMDELALDKESLTNWADLAFALQFSATDYEPSGMVDSIDIFCAIPLAAVAKSVDDWEQNHLGRWKEFTRTTPRIHRVDGAHYTMLTPQHLPSFVKILNNALKQRGI